MPATWYWLDPTKQEWISASESESIEDEYQSEQSGTRYGQRVYHCFGDGGSTGIDFQKMKTYCSSAKCTLTHTYRKISNDHLTFELKRVDDSSYCNVL